MKPAPCLKLIVFDMLKVTYDLILQAWKKIFILRSSSDLDRDEVSPCGKVF